MKKVAFEDFDSILNNFDAFCDEFESRASEAFMRGDSNNGKVVRAATSKLGGEAPSVITEVGEFGEPSEFIGETDVSVSQTESE